MTRRRPRLNSGNPGSSRVPTGMKSIHPIQDRPTSSATKPGPGSPFVRGEQLTPWRYNIFLPFLLSLQPSNVSVNATIAGCHGPIDGPYCTRRMKSYQHSRPRRNHSYRIGKARSQHSSKSVKSAESVVSISEFRFKQTESALVHRRFVLVVLVCIFCE
jgi:hypothetical protein